MSETNQRDRTVADVFTSPKVGDVLRVGENVATVEQITWRIYWRVEVPGWTGYAHTTETPETFRRDWGSAEVLNVAE